MVACPAATLPPLGAARAHQLVTASTAASSVMLHGAQVRCSSDRSVLRRAIMGSLAAVHVLRPIETIGRHGGPHSQYRIQACGQRSVRQYQSLEPYSCERCACASRLCSLSGTPPWERRGTLL